MRKRRAILIMGLGFCSAMSTVDVASAQMLLPSARSSDGAALFKQQCGTCHATGFSDAPRQGPPQIRIIGQHAGRVDGFHYSPSLAQAGFTWDENTLDAWLTNPQAVLPGAIMAYRQSKPETRAAIITYLKGLN
jgi:cytochrome c